MYPWFNDLPIGNNNDFRAFIWLIMNISVNVFK